MSTEKNANRQFAEQLIGSESQEKTASENDEEALSVGELLKDAAPDTDDDDQSAVDQFISMAKSAKDDKKDNEMKEDYEDKEDGEEKKDKKNKDEKEDDDDDESKEGGGLPEEMKEQMYDDKGSDKSEQPNDDSKKKEKNDDNNDDDENGDDDDESKEGSSEMDDFLAKIADGDILGNESADETTKESNRSGYTEEEALQDAGLVLHNKIASGVPVSALVFGGGNSQSEKNASKSQQSTLSDQEADKIAEALIQSS